MELQLPKNQHRTFVDLVRLDPNARAKLFDLLKTEPPSLKPDELASRFAGDIGVNSASAGRILWMLHNMYSARVQNGLSAVDFAEQICRAAASAGLEDIKPSPILDEVKKFLADVLSLDETLGVVSKGMSILLDQERVFIECRIITDFRPIFRENLDDPPSAAVIIHNLRISFNEDGTSNSIHVTLDKDDLDVLKAAIERAQQKEASLRKALGSSIPCLS